MLHLEYPPQWATLIFMLILGNIPSRVARCKRSQKERIGFFSRVKYIVLQTVHEWKCSYRNNFPIVSVFCGHLRSNELYAKSVTSPTAFPAVQCSSWTKFKRGECNFGRVEFMGIDASPTARGIYYVPTGTSSSSVQETNNDITWRSLFTRNYKLLPLSSLLGGFCFFRTIHPIAQL